MRYQFGTMIEVPAQNPFVTLDERGVDRLMALAVRLGRGRKTNPALKIGSCGEHGGAPVSIALCHRLGLDPVSCGPLRCRSPKARLAAAHAAPAKNE